MPRGLSERLPRWSLLQEWAQTSPFPWNLFRRKGALTCSGGYTPGFLSPERSVLILPSHFSATDIHMSQDNASTRVLLSEGLFNLMLSNHPYEKKIPQVQSVAINSNRDTAKCFPCLPIKGLGNPHCFFRLSWQDSQLLVQNAIPLKGFTKWTKVVRCGQVSLWAPWAPTFSFGKE